MNVLYDLRGSGGAAGGFFNFKALKMDLNT